ncbi:MAG: M20/M25/M40 family metallo-hydrolase [Phycisphaerales bacterium]|nr:M20/M25/M40 family metallo-hydrolase [Phycisphaerales bacterium]
MADLERIQALAGDLISIDTTSGRSLASSHGCIEGHVAQTGVEVERLPGSGEDRPSLLLRRGPLDAGGLLLCGHLDTVPPGDGWSADPLSLRASDGRWYGRGSCDMTVFCALAVELIRAIDVEGLAVLLLGDEELGALGAAAFADAWDRDRSLPRACVIGEPTSLGVIGAHSGHLKATLTINGATGHSGTPSSGRNAISAMGRALAAVESLRSDWASVQTSRGALLPVPHPVIAPVGVEGGSAWNVIPHCASLRLGIRALPDQNPRSLLEELQEALSHALAGEDWSLEVFNDNPPLDTPEDAAAHAWLLDRLGQPSAMGAPFCSDGGHLRRIGVEPVLFGPGSIAQAHRPDEFVPVSEVVAASEHLEAMIDHFCVESPHERHSS